MNRYLIILFFCLLQSVYPNNSERKIDKIQEAVRLKDFKLAKGLAEDYIKSEPKLSVDDKILPYYFKLEHDFTKLEFILESLRKTPEELPSAYYQLVLIFLEKSVFWDERLRVSKWGEVFAREAKFKLPKKYASGLYYYACILYLSGNNEDSLEIIRTALNNKPKNKLLHKLKLLKMAQLKNHTQTIIEARNFLNKYPNSMYDDFVTAFMIRAYRQAGKDKKVNSLKEKFKREYSDSILIGNILGI